MDTIQRVNLKNLMRSINDENIYNFFYDKNNIISMELKDNNFRVCVNCTYLEFQKGDLLDCIIDTIDKHIVESDSNPSILFASMRNLTKEEQDSLYETLDDISVDTCSQLFPEVNVYDYKKNLRHLKERYENKIKYINLHNDGKNTTDDKLINDGLIEGLKTAIHDISYMLAGLEVQQ